MLCVHIIKLLYLYVHLCDYYHIMTSGTKSYRMLTLLLKATFENQISCISDCHEPTVSPEPWA